MLDDYVRLWICLETMDKCKHRCQLIGDCRHDQEGESQYHHCIVVQIYKQIQQLIQKYQILPFIYILIQLTLMSHYNRRYAPLRPNIKPQSIDKSLPLKNNQIRLKQIYEGQQIFKEKNKDMIFKKHPNRNIIPLTSKKQEQQIPTIKYKPNLHNLNLAEIKTNNRYNKDHQKDASKDAHVYNSYDENYRIRNIKEQPLTSRNKEEIPPTERQQLFKLKRKSISGSLKKKLKQQVSHHLSSVNPTIPLEISYFQEGKKLYKECNISQALKLFQMGIQKNPQQPQNYYYSALCNLTKQNYPKSYEILTLILQKFPTFIKKSIYLFAAISAKHSNLIQKALSIVTNGLSKYPDYIELYLYRAKINQQFNQYKKAYEDYQIVMKTKKDNPDILLNCAICLRKLGLISNSLAMLNNAFYHDKSGQYKQKILLERLSISFQIKKYKDCKKDILKLEELNHELSEVSYYKGLIQMLQANKKAALLSFQKCIRINNCKNSIAESLIEITKSKIQDRDFYSALYHINRAKFLQISTKQIEKFRLFTEGVVFMMKRKINEGIDNFYELYNNHSPLGQYFQKLYYLYRAFGHFMQSKHAEAIKDYQIAEKYHPKDKYIKYNQLTAEGIVLVKSQKFKLALQKFDDAQKSISVNGNLLKIQPFIYRAMTFIQKIKLKNKRQSSKADQLQTLQQIFTALKELDKAYDVNDSNSNMLYLRSLIYMYLGKSQDGLQDIIKAISKSQENVAKYFFYRGLAHETLNNTKQALNDLNICINLDEKYINAYFQRAKVLFQNQQIPKGLQDLKKMKEIQPQIDIKLHQCSLYYLTKEYDLAETTLPQILNKQKRQNLSILLDLKQSRITQAKSKLTSKADKMICQILLGNYEIQQQNPLDLQYFNRVQYYNYLGIKYYHLQNYQQAINNFNLAIKQKSLLDLQQQNNNNSEEQNAGQQGEEDQNQQFISSQNNKTNQNNYLNYNLFICYLQNKQKKKAYEIFIRDILPAKDSFLRNQNIKSLSLQLFQSMKQKQEDLVLGKKKEVIEAVLFKNLYGGRSDYIQIELPNIIFKTKLCYIMPQSRAIQKQYSPKLNPNFILSCLNINQVQNRPEPPWVKRNNQDLVFTDEIININVQFQTTEHDEQNQQQEQEYQGQEQEEQYERQSQREETQKQDVVFDPKKFREQMKLDDNIEKKLKMIMEKNKKSQ